MISDANYYDIRDTIIYYKNEGLDDDTIISLVTEEFSCLRGDDYSNYEYMVEMVGEL